MKIRKLSEMDAYNIKTLDQIANVFRGSIQPPYKKDAIIHSTSYKNHWNISTPSIVHSQINKLYVQEGDILVKRVGRGCLKSFGVMRIKRKQLATDCILIVRPKEPTTSYDILFSLRVLYSSPIGENFLQKGTGAKYISAEGLLSSPIVYNLSKIYKSEFSNWLHYMEQNVTDKIEKIEQSVRERIYTQKKNRMQNLYRSSQCIERGRII
jgi:hypothetical protein